jgi:hypothetical protein
MWFWIIPAYALFLEILYKLHQMTLFQYGKFRLEFGLPPSKNPEKPERKGQMRTGRGRKQLED